MLDGAFKQIDRLILQADRILLVGHQRPDQDTLGSVLSLGLYLESLGKDYVLYTPDPAPSSLSYLPKIDGLINDREVLKRQWDLVVFLDCADLAMARMTGDDLAGMTTVAFDHHASNSGYASINAIDASASSACEIIYKFFKTIGFRLDRRSATCLLSGIISDTSGFVNSATNSEAVIIASELIKYGVKINQLFSFAIQNKTIGGLRLWGEALSRLKINQELGVAFTYIKDNDLRLYQIQEEEVEGLSNFLNVITDVSATAVFRLSTGQVKASWRTKRDDVDLAAFCRLFGGGGHKKAAGFTAPWQVVEKNGELVIL
ncbi:MAG: DHH family phosphoesterase [Patescibacteria group bacterium]|jgi:phosphoesterase RecJ-like protein